MSYSVTRIIRDSGHPTAPDIRHHNFAHRLEAVLNSAASRNQEIVDICVGAKDAIVITKIVH
jgi:hypothetical protein